MSTNTTHERPQTADAHYLSTMPTPEDIAGRRLVHNFVRPTRRLGARGFRVWLTSTTDPTVTPCDCGWAPHLGAHYRVTEWGGNR